jgi:hypothetical protein
MFTKAARFLVKAEAIQLAFAIGAVFGMVFEAILITVPKILLLVLAATHIG